MWDPATYLRFGDERSRPFVDLLARVPAVAPHAVIDLGCGPGNLTVTLAARWPDAKITALDSSTEMIDRARSLNSTVDFRVGDLRDWQPTPDISVIVSNATLHWVEQHDQLIARWVDQLRPSTWLAVQVPGNFDAPSHRALRQLLDQPRWRGVGGDEVRTPRRVPDPSGYARLLVGHGCAVDAWETTYLHRLVPSAAEHPVLAWMDGTALRPVRASLTDDSDWQQFRRELGGLLESAYPISDGAVYFPFRRVFFVARTGG